MSSVPLPVPWCLWSFWDRVWGFPATCASLQNDSAQNHIRILIFSFTYIYHAEALPIPLKKISWTGFLFFTPAVLPAPHARQWPVRFWWTRCPHMIRSLSNNPYLQVKEPWRSIVYHHCWWFMVEFTVNMIIINTEDHYTLYNDFGLRLLAHPPEHQPYGSTLNNLQCSSTRAPAIREASKWVCSPTVWAVLPCTRCSGGWADLFPGR